MKLADAIFWAAVGYLCGGATGAAASLVIVRVMIGTMNSFIRWTEIRTKQMANSVG